MKPHIFRKSGLWYCGEPHFNFAGLSVAQAYNSYKAWMSVGDLL